MIAIIPARGGSKGIPRKNVINVHGKPLIAWTIEQAKSENCFDKIVVSTDDGEIAEVALQYGAEIIKRPDSISGDLAQTASAVIHAIDVMEYDGLICLLQCTNPLRIRGDISSATLLYSTQPIGFEGGVVSVVDAGTTCLWNDGIPVNFSWWDRPGRQNRLEHYYIENGSIYVFEAKTLREKTSCTPMPVRHYVMENWQGFEIDVPWDVELVKWIMKDRGVV